VDSNRQFILGWSQLTTPTKRSRRSIGNLADDLEPARVMATIWRASVPEAPEIFPETSLDDRVAAVIESVLTENSAEIGSLEAATHREVRFDIFYPRFAGKLRSDSRPPQRGCRRGGPTHAPTTGRRCLCWVSPW
jgi:hypothetical protein